VRLVIGTRGSALALAQVALVKTALKHAFPDLETDVRTILTSGDEENRLRALAAPSSAGVKGLFTNEIHQVLLRGDIDFAVHSLKDLPGHLPESTMIAAVLERADTADVLISKKDVPEIPPGFRIGTSSVRRRRQLEWMAPGVQVKEIRGNVPTRIRKLREDSSLDAIVLARAGIDRLKLDPGALCVRTLLLLPAIGQGAIALECLRTNVQTAGLLAQINHEPTSIQIRAERELQRLLDGDCDLPVGVETELRADSLRMKAVVFEADRAGPREAELSGPGAEPETLAAHLFRILYEK